MLIAGEWQLFDDGVTRPTVRALVLSGGGNPVGEDFLIDTGAEEFVSEKLRQNLLLSLPGIPGTLSDMKGDQLRRAAYGIAWPRRTAENR